MAISRIESNSIAPSQTLTTPIIATTMGVGGATPSGSGSGITFPATQSASTNANTLDDYEEGSWTPTDGSGAGLTFNVNSATYTKVGRLVFINVYLTYPSTASSAGAAISGLPFAPQGTGYSYIIGRTQNNIGNQIVWQVDKDIAALYPNYGWNSVSTPVNSAFSAGYILISGCYQSNA